jgi:dynein heavy chain 1
MASTAGRWHALIDWTVKWPTPQAEDRAVKGHIQSVIKDWAEQKPLRGDLRPAAALDTIAIIEGRLGRIAEEFGRVCLAKSALELEPPDETRLDPLKDEVAGLKEVWAALGRVWDRVDELKETPWSTKVPRKLR